MKKKIILSTLIIIVTLLIITPSTSTNQLYAGSKVMRMGWWLGATCWAPMSIPWDCFTIMSK